MEASHTDRVLSATPNLEVRQDIADVRSWLAATLIAVLVGASWMLDGPTETDAVQASALDHADAIAHARSGYGQPPDFPVAALSQPTEAGAE